MTDREVSTLENNAVWTLIWRTCRRSGTHISM